MADSEHSDFEIEDHFDYDGRPFRFEYEYIDEEILEKRSETVLDGVNVVTVPVCMQSLCRCECCHYAS